MQSNEENNDENEKKFDICEYLNDYYMKLHESENFMISKYLEEENRSKLIFSKMSKCLNTLDKFESILMGLKNNLNDLGKNISHVGLETDNINESIKNCTKIRFQIRKYVDDLIVSPTMIQVITEDNPNEQVFIEQLHDLMHKIQTIQKYDQISSKSVDDARKIIYNLKDVAVSKIKTYLLHRIDFCRKQTTNYAIIQSSLLSFNFLYYFLQANDSNAANDVLNCYMDVMQNLYYTLMKSYISKMTDLLDMTTIPKINQLLGSNNDQKKSFFTNKSSSVTSMKVNIGEQLYRLDDRGKILNEELFNDSLIPHMITSKEKLHIETIYRSLIYALLSNCFNEIDFINDFFKLNDTKILESYFDTVYGRCFQYFLSTMDKFFSQHLDFVGLILCIGITSRYYVVSTSKKIKICLKYLNSIINMLWFRLNEVVNFNLDSLSSASCKDFEIINLLPHSITCKCSNAISTLLAIKGESSYKKIEDIVWSLFKEWRSFIDKASNEFQIKVDRLIFMGNNLYYMMESVHSTKSIPFPDGFYITTKNDNINSLNSSIIDSITSDLDIIVNDIIAIDIDKQFSYCIECIRELKQINLNEPKNDDNMKLDKFVSNVIQFTKIFSTNWQLTLKNTINRYKVLFFSLNLNSKLIQRYLNRYVQSYNTIIDFIQSTHNMGGRIIDSLSVETVDLQVIMVEIKKYADVAL